MVAVNPAAAAAPVLESCGNMLMAATDEAVAFLQRCRILPPPLPITKEVDGAPPVKPMRVSRQRRTEIRAIFDRIDADNNQRVSAKEVARFARELNIPNGIFSEHDYAQHKEGLSYSAFESLILRKERTLQQAFDTMDANHDGYIDVKELKGFLRLMQLQDWHRSGSVTWRIGHTGIEKMMKACEVYNSGPADGRISKKDLQDILVITLDERDVKNINPFFMNTAVRLQDEASSTRAGSAQSPPLWQHLLSGGAASSISKTFVSPLNVIGSKQAFLRMQDSASSVSVIQVARNVMGEAGVRGFWQGNLAKCVESFPAKGMNFFGYELFKGLFREITLLPTPVQHFSAGACAGMLSTVTTYPLDTISTRLAVQGKGAVTGFRKLTTMKGFLGLYEGLGPNLIGSAPFIGINFCTYEAAKRKWRERRGMAPDAPLGNVATLLCAGFATAIAATATWPIYNVSKRMQMQSVAGGGTLLYTNALDCAQKVLRKEGVQGLYVSWGAGMLKGLPGSSIQMLAYEQFKGVWASINRRNEETHREDEQLKGLDLCLGHLMAALSITSTGTT